MIAAAPPPALPPANTVEIAQYGGHVMWVDTVRGEKVVVDHTRGRTVTVPIAAPVRELDLGPGADGRPVAVFVRCRPGCDVWRYNLANGHETRVVSNGRKPTVWGGRLAYTHGRDVLLREHGRSRLLALRADPDDLELGPGRLAYTALADSEEGNGALELRVHALAGGRDVALDRGVIGEGDSTGFNGLTFLARGLYWQRAHRSACTVRITSFALYEPRRARRRAVERIRAPLAARRAPAAAPDTPASERCGAGG
jgi:hypothetical protein